MVCLYVFFLSDGLAVVDESTELPRNVGKNIITLRHVPENESTRSNHCLCSVTFGFRGDPTNRENLFQVVPSIHGENPNYHLFRVRYWENQYRKFLLPSFMQWTETLERFLPGCCGFSLSVIVISCPCSAVLHLGNGQLAVRRCCCKMKIFGSAQR